MDAGAEEENKSEPPRRGASPPGNLHASPRPPSFVNRKVTMSHDLRIEIGTNKAPQRRTSREQSGIAVWNDGRLFSLSRRRHLSRLRRERCSRVPCSALFAVSSMRTTGSRSMIARAREGKHKRSKRPREAPSKDVAFARGRRLSSLPRLRFPFGSISKSTIKPEQQHPRISDSNPQTYGSLPRRWPRGAARAQPARRGRPGAAPGSSATLMPQQLIASEEPSSSSATP